MKSNNLPVSPVEIIGERVLRLFDSRRAHDFEKALSVAEAIASDMQRERYNAREALNVIRTLRKWYFAWGKEECLTGEAFETYVAPLLCAVAYTFNNDMTPRALLEGLRRTAEILLRELGDRGDLLEGAAVRDMLRALCETLDTSQVWDVIDPCGERKEADDEMLALEAVEASTITQCISPRPSTIIAAQFCEGLRSFPNFRGGLDMAQRIMRTGRREMQNHSEFSENFYLLDRAYTTMRNVSRLLEFVPESSWAAVAAARFERFFRWGLTPGEFVSTVARSHAQFKGICMVASRACKITENNARNVVCELAGLLDTPQVWEVITASVELEAMEGQKALKRIENIRKGVEHDNE